MSRLSLSFLGSPIIMLNGNPIKFGRQKSLALLAYLAVTGEIHRRDNLANLLWPESTQSKAKASLRMALADLKKNF